MKKTYSAPKLTRFGTMSQLTQVQGAGFVGNMGAFASATPSPVADLNGSGDVVLIPSGTAVQATR